MHKLFAIRYSLNARSRGFTLVELIVSVGLFAIVMLVAVGALLALTGANRKAQALQSVMNNLNIALDGMVRSIRMGSNYHCGSAGGITTVQNCPTTGDTLFAFEPFGGDSGLPNDQWIYFYDASDKRIYKSVNGTILNASALTSPEVTIDNMRFYVQGTTPGCDTSSPCSPVQPKVVITVQGTAGAASLKTKTTFSIQATAVQRLLDL